MEYIYFSSPPYPHFIIAGDALYRPGDMHSKRACIGIFDMIYVEYGELFITENDHAYHLKENDVLFQISISSLSNNFNHLNTLRRQITICQSHYENHPNDSIIFYDD